MWWTRHEDSTTKSKEGPHRGWRATLALGIAGGFGVVVSYAASQPDASVGLALLLTGGCLLIGGLLGFLFGIPKALQGTPPPLQPATDASKEDRTSEQIRYRANTNLEEVSDWLTKILVGVGLTQLTQLQSQLSAFGQYFGSALGGGDVGERFAVAGLLYFSVSGFLFGYLWTRLFLGGALAEADALSRVEERLDAQELQAQHDAAALAQVSRYLQPGDSSDVDVERLKDAIKKASPSVKVQIFYQAEAVRRENWQQASDKPLMERTIPIFEALTEADTSKSYHRSWAQLGYALKDQRTPDWRRAESALSTAIRIRGDAEEFGHALYEYNRALCRIVNDPNFQAGQPSTSPVQSAIRADLRVAEDGRSELVAGTAEIQQWLQLNPEK